MGRWRKEKRDSAPPKRFADPGESSVWLPGACAVRIGVGPSRRRSGERIRGKRGMGAWLTSANHHSPYPRLRPELRWWRSDHNWWKVLHADAELTVAAPPPTNKHRHCAPRVLHSPRSPRSSARQLEVRLDEVGEEFGFEARAVGVDVAAVFSKTSGRWASGRRGRRTARGGAHRERVDARVRANDTAPKRYGVHRVSNTLA
jgi:hypothetical protein